VPRTSGIRSSLCSVGLYNSLSLNGIADWEEGVGGVVDVVHCSVVIRQGAEVMVVASVGFSSTFVLCCCSSGLGRWNAKSRNGFRLVFVVLYGWSYDVTFWR